VSDVILSIELSLRIINDILNLFTGRSRSKEKNRGKDEKGEACWTVFR
jgi:hypothetical protein